MSHADRPELDFLKRCLQYSPLDRISAQECLHHSYLRSSGIGSLKLSGGSSNSSTSVSLPMIEAERQLQYLHKTTLRQHSFLLGLEKDRYILPELNVLTEDPEWSFELREATAAWIMDTTAVYDPSTSCQRAAYFAISLLDEYFARCLAPVKDSENPIMTAPMDIVGACCMHIASKCEDVSFIGIRDLAMSLQNNYDAAELLLVEEEMLNIFQFDLYIPTVIDFLSLYLECVPELHGAQELNSFCKYLGMSTLLTIDFNAYEPSRIATAIASYALSFNTDGTKAQGSKVSVWVSTIQSLRSLNFSFLIPFPFFILYYSLLVLLCCPSINPLNSWT